MYLVVSHWQALPGKEEQFREAGRACSAVLRAQPGVEFMEGFESDGKVVVVHGYTDMAAYERVVNDPAGPFQRALADARVEECAAWVSSERGETLPR